MLEPWEMTREEYVEEKKWVVSLSARDLNVDRLILSSGAAHIKITTNNSRHTHVYPTVVGGKNPRASFTAQEEQRLVGALREQGFLTTKEAIDSKGRTKRLGIGQGFRIYGNKANIEHQQCVFQALQEGKPVPPKVLAEYPELAAQGQLI